MGHFNAHVDLRIIGSYSREIIRKQALQWQKSSSTGLRMTTKSTHLERTKNLKVYPEPGSKESTLSLPNILSPVDKTHWDTS